MDSTLNVHFHTLVLEGVFVEGADGALRFWALPPPTDEEVGMLLAAIAARVERVLRRRGFASSEGDVSGLDPVAEESPALAGLNSASLQGRIALGHRPGRRVWRARLEQLFRYLLRPAVAQDRLRLLDDGRVSPRVKTLG